MYLYDVEPMYYSFSISDVTIQPEIPKRLLLFRRRNICFPGGTWSDAVQSQGWQLALRWSVQPVPEASTSAHFFRASVSCPWYRSNLRKLQTNSV